MKIEAALRKKTGVGEKTNDQAYTAGWRVRISRFVLLNDLECLKIIEIIFEVY